MLTRTVPDGIKSGCTTAVRQKQSVNIDGVEYKAEDITEPVYIGSEWVTSTESSTAARRPLLKIPKVL